MAPMGRPPAGPGPHPPPTSGGLADRFPGPLRGGNPITVFAVLLGFILVFVVFSGDIGGIYDRDVFYPYHYPSDPAQYSYHEYYYDMSDGGLYAGGIAAIGVLMLLTTLAALGAVVMRRRPTSRYLLMAGIGLAIATLVATGAAYSAFSGWAEEEDYNEWWAGSSVYAGGIGSLLMAIVLGVALAMSGRGAQAVPPPMPVAAPGWQRPVPQQAPRQGREAFCNQCGAPLPAGDQFCNQCGKRVPGTD